MEYEVSVNRVWVSVSHHPTPTLLAILGEQFAEHSLENSYWDMAYVKYDVSVYMGCLGMGFNGSPSNTHTAYYSW